MVNSAVACKNPTRSIQKILEERIENTNAPSLSVAVAKNGKLIAAVARGWADKDKRIKASTKTQYRTGSVAKVIGVTAFMTLVEDGKVSLDDNIRSYLTYYPQQSHPILIKHLLTHTSGIRHYQFGEYGTNIHFTTLERATRVFRKDPLLFEPGSSFHYSTYGINLIQGVIEMVTGKELSDFMRTSLWRPVGMNSTRLEMKDKPSKYDAVGYRSWLTWKPVEDIDVSNKYIGGGMRSTPKDLVNMVSAFNRGDIVSSNMVENILEVPFPEASETQALGWEWIEYDGHKAYSHGGAINGFESFLVHFVDANLTVALMVNRDQYDYTSSTTYAVADLFLDKN